MPDETKHIHCDSPGLTMDESIKLEEKTQCDGVTKYWVATQAIGTLFGSEVEGECKGIGATREQALKRLEEDRASLYESLWF